MSELESNPGPIKCNHVKGAVAGVRLGRVSAQLPGLGRGRAGDCDKLNPDNDDTLGRNYP